MLRLLLFLRQCEMIDRAPGCANTEVRIRCVQWGGDFVNGNIRGHGKITRVNRALPVLSPAEFYRDP